MQERSAEWSTSHSPSAMALPARCGPTATPKGAVSDEKPRAILAYSHYKLKISRRIRRTIRVNPEMWLRGSLNRGTKLMKPTSLKVQLVALRAASGECQLPDSRGNFFSTSRAKRLAPNVQAAARTLDLQPVRNAVAPIRTPTNKRQKLQARRQRVLLD
jgi:hypothetical protein